MLFRALEPLNARAERRKFLVDFLISPVYVVHAVDYASLPTPARAAITSAAEARKSEAITGAPESFVPPLIIALGPSRAIFAPIRASSGTCIKRSG